MEEAAQVLLPFNPGAAVEPWGSWWLCGTSEQNLVLSHFVPTGQQQVPNPWEPSFLWAGEADWCL